MKLKSGFSAMGITIFILLYVFYTGQLFPFGYGTVSWCDMNQQAIPLLCDLKDILQGEGSLFLNLKNAGGMNFYGVFFFFLSSPFSFLAAFVPKIYIPYLMNVLVILKLAAAAFTAGIFFEKCFNSLSLGVKTALSVSYAFCGYGMMFFQNIMWLDIMYLFPIIMLGIYKLIREGKPLLLTICLIASVFLNFYISFMVFLFVILFFGVFALFFRNADRKIYIDLGISGVFSLGISAAVLIPCFLQYSSSGRQSGFLADLETNGFFTSSETTLQILLSSGIVLAAVLFGLPSLSSKKQEEKFLFTVFLLMAIPLVIEPVNLMWHTGSYMSFPARYGFITVFLGLCLAAKELESVKLPQKTRVKIFLPAALLGFTVILFMLRFTKVNQETLSTYVGALWGDEYSLKALTILCFSGVLGYILILLLAKKGLICRKILSALLIFIIATEGICAVNIYMVSANNRFDLYNYQSFLQLENKASKEDFYRVNLDEKLIDANMTGAAGFNSISHYTSLNSEDAMKAAKQMGYSCYWMETGNWGGSILSDALLSVGYTVTQAMDGYALRKNPYFLGLGIKTEGDVPQALSDNDRLLSVGQVFAQLTGEKNPAQKHQPDGMKDCQFYNYEDGYYAETFAEEGKVIYNINVKGKKSLYFDCYNGFSNNLSEDINGSFNVFVNGKFIAGEYPSQRRNGLLYLGSFENQTVNITLDVLQNAECKSLGVYSVDEEMVKTACQNTKSLNLKEKGGKITGKVSVGGKYFLSLPYSDDLNIKLNGKKVEYTKVLTGYILLDLPKGGQLEISLIPKGFYPALIISILFVCILVLVLVVKPKFSKNLKNIVFGIFLGVFSIMVLAVYIIPTIIKLLYYLKI